MNYTPRVWLQKKHKKRKDPDTGKLRNAKGFNWYLTWEDPFARYPQGTKSAGRPVMRSQPLGAANSEHARKDAVEAKAVELKEYKRTGVPPEHNAQNRSITWAEFVPEHLAGLRGRKKRSTPVSDANRKARQLACDEFGESVGPDTPMVAIDVGMVERFENIMCAEAKAGTRRARDATIAKKLTQLRAVFNHAMRLGYARTNPVPFPTKVACVEAAPRIDLRPEMQPGLLLQSRVRARASGSPRRIRASVVRDPPDHPTTPEAPGPGSDRDPTTAPGPLRSDPLP